MTNAIYQTVEKLKNDPDFIDLTDSNFVNNGYKYPANKLESKILKYFQNREYNPDALGLENARQTICDYYKKIGINYNIKNICITASTSEAYNLVFALFTKPGDEVLMPSPGYPLFEYFTRFNKLKIKYYKMDPDREWTIDVSSLKQSITKRTKFIVLISPNNPTGQIISESTLKEISGIAIENNLMIISDEVFNEFKYITGALPRLSNISKDVTVFTLNGISKMFALPDMKLAWIAISGKHSDKLSEELETANDTFLNANYLTQTILPDIFSDGKSFQRKMIDDFAKKANWINSYLKSNSNIYEFNPIQGGIHLVIGIKRRIMNEEKFILDLVKETKVLVHPGYFYEFALLEKASVIVALASNQIKLEEGLSRITKFILQSYPL